MSSLCQNVLTLLIKIVFPVLILLQEQELTHTYIQYTLVIFASGSNRTVLFALALCSLTVIDLTLDQGVFLPSTQCMLGQVPTSS